MTPRSDGRGGILQDITCRPIGFVRSPFTRTAGTPIQPLGGNDVEAVVEVLEEFAAGVSDLEGFSHIILIYHFHTCDATRLRVKPFLDEVERGVFATRAPARPNHIGMSVVRLERVEGNLLHITGVDMLDGTPVLDIKPHIPRVDCPEEVRTGWLEGKEAQCGENSADDRFNS